jgi:hypothetical protein
MCAVVVAAGCSTSTPRAGNADPVSEADESRVVLFEEPVANAIVSTGSTLEDAPLLRAAETGDPEIMAAALATPGLAAACHGRVTCPAFGSCSAWSAASDCGDRQCNATCGICLPRGDPNCEFPFASTQPSESFRVCFNSAGASCVEWASGPSRNPKCRDAICNGL